MENENRLQRENLFIKEEKFEKLLKPLLGSTYERAVLLFRNCGPNLSFDVTNVLHLASSQGSEKVDEVLGILERHYDKHLYYQDPEATGLIRDNLLDVNPTEAEFLRICTVTLGLKPKSAHQAPKK